MLLINKMEFRDMNFIFNEILNFNNNLLINLGLDLGAKFRLIIHVSWNNRFAYIQFRRSLISYFLSR